MSDNVALKNKARKSLNVCPICWMPLYYYVPEEKGIQFRDLDIWRELQVVFKGKHSFSLENETTSEGVRNKEIFGACDLFFNENDMNFVHDCHFFHKFQSSVDKYLTVNNTWNRFTGNSDSEKTDYPMELDVDYEMGAKTQEFYEYVCIENGLFKSSGGVFKTYERVCEYNTRSIDQENKIVFGNVDSVFRQMCDTFAGCIDCNKKMSTFRYVEVLFTSFFPHGTFLKQKVMLSKEIMTHYLILSGLIERSELVISSQGSYLMNIEKRENRKSWKFRFMIIWCFLQILFSLWEEDETGENFGHHKNYIYTGTADFYMGFIFYLMFRSTDQMERAEFISFESFHYFYTSYVPFFLRKHRDDHIDVVNISREVLSRNMHVFICPNRIAGGVDHIRLSLREQMKILQDLVCDFWVVQMRYISLYVYDTVSPGVPYHDFINMKLNEFFCPCYRVLSILNQCIGAERNSTKIKLSVKGYAEKIGSYLYWFHFRQITVVRIKQLCKEYKEMLERGFISVSRSAALKLWNDWFIKFDKTARDLTARKVQKNDVRVFMMLKNEMIRY
jgi:hypothetical protein